VIQFEAMHVRACRWGRIYVVRAKGGGGGERKKGLNQSSGKGEPDAFGAHIIAASCLIAWAVKTTGKGSKKGERVRHMPSRTVETDEPLHILKSNKAEELARYGRTGDRNWEKKSEKHYVRGSKHESLAQP